MSNAEKKEIPPFYSRTNLPEGACSPVGSAIYEWEYMLDEDEFEERVDKKTGETITVLKRAKGSLIKDKKNVQEEIQSYRRQVDYKEKIKRGELEQNENLIYMDTTELGDDFSSVEQYISNLVAKAKKEIEASHNRQTNQKTTEVKEQSNEDKQQVAETNTEGGASK